MHRLAFCKNVVHWSFTFVRWFNHKDWLDWSTFIHAPKLNPRPWKETEPNQNTLQNSSGLWERLKQTFDKHIRSKAHIRRSEAYMLTTWQTVELAKEQLQLKAFSTPFTWTEDVQLLSPLHGSTLKFQSFFPSFLAISFITCTEHSKPTSDKDSSYTSSHIVRWKILVTHTSTLFPTHTHSLVEIHVRSTSNLVGLAWISINQ